MTQIYEQDHLLTLFRICAFFLITLNSSVVMRRISSSMYLPASNLIRYNSDPLAILYETVVDPAIPVRALPEEEENCCAPCRWRQLSQYRFGCDYWLFVFHTTIIASLQIYLKKKMTQFSDRTFVTKPLELIFSSKKFILIILSVMLCAQHFAEYEPSSTDEIQQ